MKFLFLLLVNLKIIFSFDINKIIPLKEIFLNQNIKNNDNQEQDYIKSSIKKYLETFKGFNETLFNICIKDIFQKTGSIDNFLHLLSYSGKGLSDLGQESSCIRNDFSYHLISYTYNKTEDNKNNEIFKFLENSNFYTGLCLLNECTDFINELFHNNQNNIIKDVKIQEITYKENKECENDLSECKNKAYYTLSESGIFDENLTKEEKSKYEKFYFLFVLTIIIICLEIVISIFIYCGYNQFNNDNYKNLTNELFDQNLDEDEENYDEEPTEKVLYSNSSSSKEKQYESCSQLIIKALYKYFSFFTNILILIIRKSKFNNNRNLETINKFRLVALLLITFSTNFDVYLKVPSKGFYHDFLYKRIYFVFLKFASFGLDIYICLDGFEVMYKLMNYYKKYFYDKGKKTITLKGIVKFYLFSVYKIFGYIILFFIVNYFNRYYIYMHNNGTLYSYYSNNINNANKNPFKIFNPKYTLLSYLPIEKKYDNNFLFNSKMSLLFINEFIAFTFFIIIFYLGNYLKSKIYNNAILFYILISYFLSYLLDNFKDNKVHNISYTYNLIVRNISLIKYPHILFNHYLLGAFTGLICFYIKDSITNNPMVNEPDKCPFNFCLNIIELFEYLVQRGRKVWIAFSFIIQFMICISFTIIINTSENDKVPLKLNTPLKIFYYYESGLFVFTFCFNTVLFFANDDGKNYDNYNLLNLFSQISFSYVNTVYLMMYSYYCFFGFQLKLTYQNLWLVTFGLFIFFSFENIIITIIFIMPFKIFLKTIFDKYIVINPNSLSIEDIKNKENKRINISGFSNEYINNIEDDDYDNDKNEKSK